MKKLFGGLRMTWPRVLLFTVITAVYTALINQVPFLNDTSLRDIAITHEWWIFFALILITNGRSPLDAALKTFVFFLLGQPLIYLVEVPFLGWDVFRYYLNWIVPTLLTFPMAFVGWFLTKRKWWSLIILSPMLLLLGVYAVEFFRHAMFAFPRHLLSGLFCVFQMVLYCVLFVENARLRRIGASVCVAAVGVAMLVGMLNPKTYQTTILFSDEEAPFDGGWSVTLEDASLGDVQILYNQPLGCWMLDATFVKEGETTLTLTDGNGQTLVYTLQAESDSYTLEPTTP